MYVDALYDGLKQCKSNKPDCIVSSLCVKVNIESGNSCQVLFEIPCLHR